MNVGRPWVHQWRDAHGKPLSCTVSPHFPLLQCSQAAQLGLGKSGGPDAALPFLNKITDAGVSVCNSLSTRILLGRRSKVGRAQPRGCSAHSLPRCHLQPYLWM